MAKLTRKQLDEEIKVRFLLDSHLFFLCFCGYCRLNSFWVLLSPLPYLDIQRSYSDEDLLLRTSPKNLGNIKQWKTQVDVLEILPPFGRLDDIEWQ